MSKFRTWLIKKLGGFIINPQINSYMIKTYMHPIKIYTKMKFNACDIDMNDESLKSYAKEKIAYKIASQLIDENIIRFSVEKDAAKDEYIYTASTYVYKEEQ